VLGHFRPDSSLRPRQSDQCSESGGTLRIWDLSPGMTIRIINTFRDTGGNEITKGTILHFKHPSYLPYHSGHTVRFQESAMCLCDLDDTRAVVENVGAEYFEEYKGD